MSFHQSVEIAKIQAQIDFLNGKEKAKELTAEEKTLIEIGKFLKENNEIRKLTPKIISDETATEETKLRAIAALRIEAVTQEIANEDIRANAILIINIKLAEDLKAIDDKRVQGIKNNSLSLNDALSKGIAAAVKKEEEAAAEKQLIFEKSVETAIALSNSLTSITTARIDNEIAQLNRLRDAELKNIGLQETALNQAIGRRLISQKEFEDQINALAAQRIATEQSISDKIREEQRKRAIAEKKNAIFQILLNNAIAISANLKNAVLLPFIIALGALQLGTALATPIPQFGKGGLVDGNSHKQGGKMINAEGGEYIINKKDTGRYKAELEAANKGALEDLIYMKHVLPALKEQERKFKEKSFANNIVNSMMFNGTDELAQIMRGGTTINNVDELGKAIAKHLINGQNIRRN